MLDAQNQHARKVHQRADVEHHDCDLVPRDEAQIAYGKDRHCHYHRHQHGGGGDDQPGRNPAATLKTEQKTVNHRIDHRQQQQGQRRSQRNAASSAPQPAVMPQYTGFAVRDGVACA